jgi:hypothetical protein
LKINEGSKVMFKLHGCGSDDIIKTCTADKGMVIHSDSITLIDGGLYCTDSIQPVEEIDDETYIINIWIQDAYCVTNDTLYESINDSF